LDEPAIRSALNACLMTDAEMTAGPEVWATIHDPLPVWPNPNSSDATHSHPHSESS